MKHLKYFSLFEQVNFGDSGVNIKKIQETLKSFGLFLGYTGDDGDGIDGIIGRLTMGAVKTLFEILSKNGYNDIDMVIDNSLSDEQEQYVIN